MPKQATDRSNTAHIPFRCSPELFDQIEKIALMKGASMSTVLRSLVEDGLIKQGYTQDEDHLYKLIKAAVTEVLSPSVERLASISAKGAQAAGSCFGMSTYVALTQATTEQERDAVEEAAGQVRSMGIQFLKLKQTQNLDVFLTGVAKEARDNLEGRR